MAKQICHRCKKPISGKIKIITYRKKLGSKSINKVEMFDEVCFKIKSKEKSINKTNKSKKNECCKQKRLYKKRR